jgi:hypothetical protein
MGCSQAHLRVPTSTFSATMWKARLWTSPAHITSKPATGFVDWSQSTLLYMSSMTHAHDIHVI